MADAFLDADRFARPRSFVTWRFTRRSARRTIAPPSLRRRNARTARDRYARHQTAGRGRGKHTWWSAEGALTFSVLLEPSTLGIHTRSWPQLSLATAVAICDALAVELRQYEVASAMPRIKWPNDVLIDGRKVCGILIESPAQPGVRRRCLVVGIGVNVNNSWKTAPAESSRERRQFATSRGTLTRSRMCWCKSSTRRSDNLIALLRMSLSYRASGSNCAGCKAAQFPSTLANGRPKAFARELLRMGCCG